MKTPINCFLFVICVISVNSLNVKDDDDLEVLLASSNSKIRGHILQSAKGNNFYAFQQIPYGAPPTGNLRFKSPQKPNSWTGVLDATNNTKVCPQVLPTTLPQDEDCLFVNVYTPVHPNSTKKLAVYVWIHGGAYAVWDGAINRYGPQYLIDYNIVVVTLQYRLGAFGFLATEDGVIPGNLGLRDQNLALRWVQENIHLFGGDKKKVTIGGESAGASSVSMHILSPLSKGLFRGAIQESGSAMCSSYQKKTDYYAFEYGRLIDSSLKNGETLKLLKLLQEASVADLVEAQTKMVNEEQWISLSPDVIWGPIIETSVKADEAFLSEPMDASFRNGIINKMPMLVGFNQEEMLWSLPSSIFNTIPPFKIQWDQLDQLISRLDGDSYQLVNDKLNILDANKTTAGTLIKQIYTNTTFANDRGAYIKFAGDMVLSLPTIRQAQLASHYISHVYLYQFAYTAYNNKSIIQGAEHTEELPYFWHNLENPAFINSFQTVLQHRMLKLWTNFIKHQNPTPKVDKELDSIIWPAVDPNVMPYLNISETFKIGSNPRNYLQFDNILSKFTKPPFSIY